MENTSVLPASKQASPQTDYILVIRAIIKRWFVILLTAVFAAMAAFVVTTQTYTPVYSCSATFVVSDRGSSTSVFSNISTTANLAVVFSEVVNSSVLRKTVLNELGWTDFDGTITAASIEETNLITLTVTASSPADAFLVADSIVKNHSLVSSQVLGDCAFEVLQSPKVPFSPSNPVQNISNAKKAFVIGLIASAVLIGIFAYLRGTVKNRDDIKEYISTPLLGTVYHEQKYKTLRARIRRAKSSILITNPLTSFGFIEAYKKLRVKLETKMAEENAKVLMVTSLLEDEGKSTAAVNTALALAQKHKRVLLIDADVRKPACYKILNCHVKKGESLNDVLTHGCHCRKAAVYNENYRLYTLLNDTPASIFRFHAMKDVLNWARSEMDYVVIDTSPMGIVSDTEALAEIVDCSLFIIRQDRASVRAINDAVNILQNTGSKLLGCVFNNVVSGSSFFAGDNIGYKYGYGYGYGKQYGYGYGSYQKSAGGRKEEGAK